MRLSRALDLSRVCSHAHEGHLTLVMQMPQHMKGAQVAATGEWVQRAGFDPQNTHCHVTASEHDEVGGEEVPVVEDHFHQQVHHNEVNPRQAVPF